MGDKTLQNASRSVGLQKRAPQWDSRKAGHGSCIRMVYLSPAEWKAPVSEGLSVEICQRTACLWTSSRALKEWNQVVGGSGWGSGPLQTPADIQHPTPIWFPEWRLVWGRLLRGKARGAMWPSSERSFWAKAAVIAWDQTVLQGWSLPLRSKQLLVMFQGIVGMYTLKPS